MPTALALPTEEKIGEIFDKIMDGLFPDGYRRSKILGTEPVITYRVCLEGLNRIHLAIENPREFSYRMAEAMLGRPANNGEVQDALRELLNLYCGHFRTEFWAATGRWEPCQPTPGHPRDWPRREPDREAERWAFGCPVVIRVWFEPLPWFDGRKADKVETRSKGSAWIDKIKT